MSQKQLWRLVKMIKWRRTVKFTEITKFTFEGKSKSCTLEPHAQTCFQLLTLSKEQTAHNFWSFVHKYGTLSLTTGKPNSLFSRVQCGHSVLPPWIPTLQTSRSVRGETACGSAWAASPACRPAGWRSASPSGRTPSRQRESPERTAMSQCCCSKTGAIAALFLHGCFCTCSTNMFNSQTLPCRGWSPPAPSSRPLRSPPARWWLPRAGWWLASPWPGAHTK